VVASVSCIYGLGLPENYLESTLIVKVGEKHDRDDILRKLVTIKYERNDMELDRGKFRVRGGVIEVQPAYEKNSIRIELEDDIVKRISEVEIVTQKVIKTMEIVSIYPGTHFVTNPQRLGQALTAIEEEMKERVKELKSKKKLLEAQRIEQRTRYDLEMIREIGYCSGIENYSRHMEGRAAGLPPSTLIDFFPKDYLLFIDESHVTLPQLHAMYGGDRSRKENLIDHGFRLPSAFDNRPLKYEEFMKKINQAVFVSATPGAYETKLSKQIVEQIIRPTGLIDPEVVTRTSKGQIEDLEKEIRKRVEKKERVLVTTLTKRMAEDLTEYLEEKQIKVRYLHSDVETLDRIDILRGLRLGEFDVLVGINLLREGLDLPEVSLVAILDADKEGFLRSETSLVQTIGRAARNVNGLVILYGENKTGSITRALSETNRRRKLQIAYNKKHNITPMTIIKEVTDISENIREGKLSEIKKIKELASPDEISEIIKTLEEEMSTAAISLDFEKAAELRDKIKEIKKITAVG